MEIIVVCKDRFRTGIRKLIDSRLDTLNKRNSSWETLAFMRSRLKSLVNGRRDDVCVSSWLYADWLDLLFRAEPHFHTTH